MLYLSYRVFQVKFSWMKFNALSFPSLEFGGNYLRLRPRSFLILSPTKAKQKEQFYSHPCYSSHHPHQLEPNFSDCDHFSLFFPSAFQILLFTRFSPLLCYIWKYTSKIGVASDSYIGCDGSLVIGFSDLIIFAIHSRERISYAVSLAISEWFGRVFWVSECFFCWRAS